VIQVLKDGGTGAAGDSSTKATVAHVASYVTVPSTDRFQQHYLAGLTAWGHPYSERTGARLDRILDNIGWPVGRRDLSDGNSRHGAYLPAGRSALDVMRECNEPERGILFVGTDGSIAFRDRNWLWTSDVGVEPSFGDATGDKFTDVIIDANTVEALRNSVQVTWANGTYTKTDVASVAAYGPANLTLSVPTQESRSQVENLAAFIFRTQKDPATRITRMTINIRRDATVLSYVVAGFELGQRIIVTLTPQDIGSALTKTLTVQGIQHDIGTDEWTATLYLSPAWETYETAPYLTLGDATYGQIGAVAGNKVPY
jgi:hypothetical protein